ncbi:hypothetical protein AAZX31_07G147700 [Glycine max]
MEQLYFDVMTICGQLGFPDLFLTFTCNPNWPEIERNVKILNLRSDERPDMVTKVFKQKLDDLINDLKSRQVFGQILGYVYTIEWQKRGLPHAHILIFLHHSNKRRNNGNVVERNSVTLDNKFVVLYSPILLLRYRAHLNVEWCNQSTSIKYLFKYINKGSDRITAAIVNVNNSDGTQTQIHDEIKNYLDCRYVSPCEACWKIFSFLQHGRKPTVERLYFHLEDEHPMLEAKKTRIYGLLMWVPASTGELFFMRMILSIAKGPTSYDEIIKIDGVQYPTFRAACFALGFLGNDQEFIGQLTNEEVQHRCLCRIEDLLQGNGKSLKSFSAIPYPIGHAPEHIGNKLIHEELDYNKETLQMDFNSYYSSLTSDIVLTVASSGIASLLLSGGRTVHSKFVIPVPATASSTCNIHQGSDLAKLLKVTKLIIWDEAPVCNKFCFEALDKSLKDIIRDTNSNHLPFSGKVVVFGGDFHHILSVVPKGSRFDIVHATINSSYLWNHCQFYNNPEYLQSRAILASTIEVIDKVNEYVMSLIPGDEIEYYGANSINKSDALQNPTFETVTPEFLNSLNTSGIPNHEMKLKVGTPIMLLRNMAQKDVLCNGTRLIISRLSAHIIEAKIIFGKNNDHKTYIPRMNMSPLESPWPFKLIRRQFPFMSKQGLHILIHDQQGKPCNTTINVVYKEVFQNL